MAFGSKHFNSVTVVFFLVAACSAQTHIKAATVDAASNGTFTNTQNNLNSKFNVGNIDFLDLFKNHVQGGNPNAFTTDAFTGGIYVPSGATVLQANGVSGYAKTDSTTTFTVGGYFPCLANVAGSSCWGVNTWAGDTPGLPNTTQLRSIEADLNLNNALDTGYGIVVQGFWGASPGLAEAFFCQRPGGPGAGFGWSHCFATSPSASTIAFLAAPRLLGGPSISQLSVWEAYDSSNALITGNMYLSETGDLVFGPGVPDHSFATDQIKPKGGSPPTCEFTTGGGTSPSCALSTGASNAAGIIILTTGSGSPAGKGTVTMTFHSGNPIGVFPSSCVYTASDGGTSAWQDLAVIKDLTPGTTSDVFSWTNQPSATGANTIAVPTALSTATNYWVNYHCWGQ